MPCRPLSVGSSVSLLRQNQVALNVVTAIPNARDGMTAKPENLPPVLRSARMTFVSMWAVAAGGRVCLPPVRLQR